MDKIFYLRHFNKQVWFISTDYSLEDKIMPQRDYK